MSSDIFIPLSIVITNPALFELKTDFNVDVKSATQSIVGPDPDYEWIRSCLEPVVLCKFGARDTWRFVDVTSDNELHISCSGEFRGWLMKWLIDLKLPYKIVS